MHSTVVDKSGPARSRRIDQLDRVIVVRNPHSRYSSRQVESAFTRFAPSSTELIFRETDLRRPIAEIIADSLQRASFVVAAGGDGTVSAVATALLGSGIPVGIIPGGTTNMVAKVNRIPRNLDRAVALLFGDHRIEQVDVGRCNSKAILHIGGAGLDARIFSEAPQSLKRRVGWMAYGIPIFSNIRRPASRFTITVDGRSVTARSRLVLVANCSSMLHARLSLYPHVSRTDGEFDVIVFTADDAASILRSVGNLATLSLQRSPYVVHLKGREITIDADPPMPYELDGDVAGMTPMHVAVEPLAIGMICGP